MSTLDNRIERVRHHIFEYKIGIAEQLARSFEGGDADDPFEKSGWAILDIVGSYFEFVGQIELGVPSTRQGVNGQGSTEAWNRGFQSVYEELAIQDWHADLYSVFRCGMYHDGMPRGCVAISREQVDAFQQVAGQIILNPAKLVEDIRLHAERLFARLTYPTCDCEARSRFRIVYEDIERRSHRTKSGLSPVVSPAPTTVTAAPVQTTCDAAEGPESCRP